MTTVCQCYLKASALLTILTSAQIGSHCVWPGAVRVAMEIYLIRFWPMADHYNLYCL